MHSSPSAETGQQEPFALTREQRDVYRRYASLPLPRHTSYPAVPAWTSSFGQTEYRAALQRSAENGRPLSLYVHVPFCQQLCYYCACTKEIVPSARRRASDPAEAFLTGLDAEAARLATIVGHGPVYQIHIGGGTPTFLTCKQLQRLWDAVHGRFDIRPTAEIAIEIDPRVTTFEQLQLLRELGFNRVSLGVQDFAEPVQRAVNRVQPYELVAQVVTWCRALGFASINFDLIYGLPFQTLDTMADTLDKTIALAPDRIAFYRLAVIPELFRWQNVFHRTDLPDGDLPLELNLMAINQLQSAGYDFIGIDHFARSTEALHQAALDGSLRRTFQGMTTGKDLDILGLGPSGISQLNDAYAQNHKATADWHRAATEHHVATERGLRLTRDDCLRREALQQLYAHGIIRKRTLENQFRIPFDEYFADELKRLQMLTEEGLVVAEGETIRLSPVLGRLLVRVVAAVFDHYLPREAFREGLPQHLASKVG